jgi:hypothetical protein
MMSKQKTTKIRIFEFPDGTFLDADFTGDPNDTDLKKFLAGLQKDMLADYAKLIKQGMTKYTAQTIILQSIGQALAAVKWTEPIPPDAIAIALSAVTMMDELEKSK